MADALYLNPFVLPVDERVAERHGVAEMARADPRVDADRVAIWFFSGGGLLLADWLRRPPGWLRGVAASYPPLAPLPGWEVDTRFRPVETAADRIPPGRQARPERGARDFVPVATYLTSRNIVFCP